MSKRSRPWVMLVAGVELAAADQRAHARLELGQVERLGHVVVGAEVEALDPLLERVARGEDQHRHARAPVAQAPQHRQAVELGQRDVEHHQVVAACRERRLAASPSFTRSTA